MLRRCLTSSFQGKVDDGLFRGNMTAVLWMASSHPSKEALGFREVRRDEEEVVNDPQHDLAAQRYQFWAATWAIGGTHRILRGRKGKVLALEVAVEERTQHAAEFGTLRNARRLPIVVGAVLREAT